MKSSEHQPEPLQNSLNDDLHLIDQQFEQLLLRQHAVEHVRRQADAFSRLTGCEDPLSGDTEGEDEEDSFPSPDFSALDEAIFQQLDQTQKKRNRSRFFRYTQKTVRVAASFLVVALAGFSVLFFSVDAVKLNVIDFIVRSHEVATEFHIEDMLGNVPEQIPELNESDFMEPTYIPSGFSQSSAYFMTGHGYIVYERPGCEYLLNYSCMTLNTFLSLDTEDCISEQLSVNGNKAYLYTKFRGPMEGHCSLIWHDGRYIYLISGPVNKKEIVKMAESIG